MTQLRLENITKQFNDHTALDDISLLINDGEFFVLLGPTGAGKTTTLRVIAGLEKPDKGVVYFNDNPVNDVSPAERDTAFVFQQYSLYPNMTVFDNLAFPLKSPLRRTPKDEMVKRIHEVADILNIRHLLERKTARLSGGEMQRVSIGRAIVRKPSVYLMDEPLSNLDAKLREKLRVELEHIQKTQKSTTVFVTHDQVEALTMADRLAVLDQGKILQVGTPYEIYDTPATTYVAQLVGSPRINLLNSKRDNDNFYVHNSELSLPVPAHKDLPESTIIGIRPEDIQASNEGEFSGHVVLTEPLGVETVVHIGIGEQTILCIIPGTYDVNVGENINFNILTERVHYFDQEGKRV